MSYFWNKRPGHSAARGTQRDNQTSGKAAATAASAATGTGSSASVQKGIFYIRGAFVQTTTQTIVLDAYSATPSYRIGFQVTDMGKQAFYIKRV